MPRSAPPVADTNSRGQPGGGDDLFPETTPRKQTFHDQRLFGALIATLPHWHKYEPGCLKFKHSAKARRVSIHTPCFNIAEIHIRNRSA